MVWHSFTWGSPTGPPTGSPRKSVARPPPHLPVGAGFGWLWLGFGWLWLALLLRISDGFRFDSRSGLALAWFRLDLASGLHLLGFWLDSAWIWLDFGWILFAFGRISAWILHFRLLLLGFLFILASRRLS